MPLRGPPAWHFCLLLEIRGKLVLKNTKNGLYIKMGRKYLYMGLIVQHKFVAVWFNGYFEILNNLVAIENHLIKTILGVGIATRAAYCILRGHDG